EAARWRALLSDSRSRRSPAPYHCRLDARCHGCRADEGAEVEHEPPDEPLLGTASAPSAGVLTKKKSFVAVERNTPENRVRRRFFCALLTLLQVERLVFLDESSCATGMRREHAWSKRGRRAVGSRPFGRWKTVSLIC